MNAPDPSSAVPPAPDPHDPHEKPSALSRFLETVQFLIALGLTGGVLFWLLVVPAILPKEEPDKREPPNEVVSVVGDKLICIKPGTPLADNLDPKKVEMKCLSTPKITVTARVAASLRPGRDQKTDYWQFDSPENLVAFTDWQKAVSDISFNQEQLKSITKLADARVEAQQKVVDRLEKTFTAGVDSRKDLDAEKANLVQLEIQGNKDKHEAKTALRLAERAEAVASRQLQQNGLEPALLEATGKDIDIVMADVPEARIDDVKVGVEVAARFVSLGPKKFLGTVDRIAPTISKDRHSLRVLCKIKDPVDELRPGMFADLGIDTKARDTKFVPADAVLHVGRGDYVLVSVDQAKGLWKVVPIKIGDLRTEGAGDLLEVTSGLEVGDLVLSKGAILIKPAVVRCLAAQQNWTAASAPPSEDRK
jgi:membrane fusion protein, heavy metal efflux system